MKLLLSPVLILSASLAGRRWGPAVSGCIIGLPLTSGPVSFLLALTHGTTFATSVAVGTLSATLSQVAFCLTYAYIGRMAGWRTTVLAGGLAFVTATLVLQPIKLGAVPWLIVVAAGMALALHVMPGQGSGGDARYSAPPWDLPARMAAATVLVLLLTALAQPLGARLTGLIAPFPVYGSIFVAFTHAQRGRAAAASLLRGFVLGLSATVGFYFVLAELLPGSGIAPAFLTALGVAVCLQVASLGLLRHMKSGVRSSLPSTSLRC